MVEIQEALLRGILATTARQAFPIEQVEDLVISGRGGFRQRQAFNLCDGRRSQAQIARESGIDPASLNRTMARWVEAGIVLRLGEGRDTTFLHIYPLAESASKKRGGTK